MKLVLQIAGGIVLAGFVWFIFSLLFAGAALKAVDHAAKNALTELQQKQQQQSQERRTRQAAQAAERQRQDLARKQQAASQLRAESDAVASKIREEEQKEAAWQAFYQPTPECMNPPTWEIQVECGNRHIRAKREFELGWQQGRFR